jgi:signal peptidase I
MKQKTERRGFFRWHFLLFDRRRHNRFWAVALVLSIPAFLLCERYVVSAGRVTDLSMLPTLEPGGYFLVNRFIVRVSPIQRGDVVVVSPVNHPRWYYVKRVVALGGETLSILGGGVLVNGRPLEEPYAVGRTEPEMRPQRIPEGFYFLMGDNRASSEDSRAFGPVPKERIAGKIKPGRLFSIY